MDDPLDDEPDDEPPDDPEDPLDPEPLVLDAGSDVVVFAPALSPSLPASLAAAESEPLESPLVSEALASDSGWLLPAVGAVEAGALEDDADGVEDLPQPGRRTAGTP